MEFNFVYMEDHEQEGEEGRELLRIVIYNEDGESETKLIDIVTAGDVINQLSEIIAELREDLVETEDELAFIRSLWLNSATGLN